MLVAGPLAAAFAGAGIGGAGEALTKAGLSDSKSTEYVEYLKKGDIIISVDPKNPDDRTYFGGQEGVIYNQDTLMP